MATSRKSSGGRRSALTSSRAGSRANPSATPDGSVPRKIRGGSGPRLRAPFATYDPASSCWKTLQVSFLAESETYSATFPRSGTMRSGKLYRRRKRVLGTVGIASGLWATPAAADAQGSHGGGQGRSLRTDVHTMKHSGAVPSGVEERWPTPTVTDARDMPARTKVADDLGETPSAKHALSLMVAVKVWPGTSAALHEFPTPDTRGFTGRGSLRKLAKAVDSQLEFDGMASRAGVRNREAAFPTPTAGMHKQDVRDGGEYAERTRAQGHQLMLPSVVKLLPTPLARDHKDSGSQAKLAGLAQNDTLPRVVATEHMATGSQVIGTLNPKWVEWLMGFPIGWLA